MEGKGHYTFQFHNGTIKTNGGTTEISPNSIFQFHNGTIKTRAKFIGEFEATEFQFHNGTIKTNQSIRFRLRYVLSIP